MVRSQKPLSMQAFGLFELNYAFFVTVSTYYCYIEFSTNNWYVILGDAIYFFSVHVSNEDGHKIKTI